MPKKAHIQKQNSKKESLPRTELCKSSPESAEPILGVWREGGGWACLGGQMHVQSSTGHVGSCCCSPAAPRTQREQEGWKRDCPPRWEAGTAAGWESCTQRSCRNLLYHSQNSMPPAISWTASCQDFKWWGKRRELLASLLISHAGSSPHIHFIILTVTVNQKTY